MPTYATVDDVEAYVEGGTGLDPGAVERYIERAERRVDLATGFMGMTGPLSVGPRYFDPARLSTRAADALKNATCAQVEYMLEMGDSFFVQDQYESSSDEEGSATGKLSRTGPRVKEELRYGGMLRVTARVR